MDHLLTQFANAEPAASAGIFEALGINWTSLLLQIVAFLILVWILNKYVYPILIKSVDSRQDKIDAGAKAAVEAEKKAAVALAEVKKLMQEARVEASEIVASAKEEANATIEQSHLKAKTQADQIVTSAHEQIEKDVIAAKKSLHNETIDLVAFATEKILGGIVTDKIDEKVIASAIKEVR